MGLFSYFLWAFGDLTLLVLVYRARKSRLLGRYRYFYAYLLSILCSQVIKIYMVLAHQNRGVVLASWWVLEFVTAMAGFGVTWEVYRQTLSCYEGVRRMARTVLTGLFATLLLRAIVELSDNPIKNLGPTTLELDRNLRVVQALLLLAVVSLIVYYSIPLGRNLWSILIGYGLLVATSVITLTLGAQFAHLSDWKWWSVPPQLEYCA